jgi:hypothetical protein
MIRSFKEFLKEKYQFYKTIEETYCPILDEKVIFNAKGFYHLRYNNHGKERIIKEQIYKINLLPLVLPVIKNANTIYEYKKERYSKPLNKFYEIWEIRARAGKEKALISVVLRRIGDGKITFLSVWKNDNGKTKKFS